MSEHGFPKARRVRRRPEFLRVQNGGLRVSCAHFVFLVAAHPAVGIVPGVEADLERESGMPAARLGLVVTKKVGPAVARNRIKRVCRECFRTWADLVPRGVDVLVIAKSGADELGLEDVRREWQRAQRQLGEAARKAVANARKKTHVSRP